MTNKFSKLLTIDLVIALIAIIAVAIFDLNLQLGKFSGLVFGLYLLYFGIGLLLIHLITALWQWLKLKRSQRAVDFVVAGLISAILTIAVAYLVPSIFFNY
jgi:hypothetical protein